LIRYKTTWSDTGRVYDAEVRFNKSQVCEDCRHNIKASRISNQLFRSREKTNKERETERQTERERDRQTERERERERETETDRQTDRDRQTE